MTFAAYVLDLLLTHARSLDAGHSLAQHDATGTSDVHLVAQSA